jgi:hypothetical protein
MSAYAYVDIADIPPNIMATRSLGNDEATGAVLVAFEGCPVAGVYDETAKLENALIGEIEYPFPREPGSRNALVDWFMYHGIHFTVVM